MKKTLNINLGGLAFIIDENAFDLLQSYLEAVKSKFKNDAERKEIMNDIEARMAEMLNQKLGGRKEVVSVEDVQQVQLIMGKPEDIAGEEESIIENPAPQPKVDKVFQSAHRKLYRDADDSKVGGVISGLCHYLGINDPVWVRVAAAALIFFTSGGIILIYLLLLVIVPKAETSAEKLQMKGEPVNISNIEKEIRDAAIRTGQSVNKLMEDGNFFQKVWHVVKVILKGVIKIIAVIAIGIGLIILAPLILAFLGIAVASNNFLLQAPRLLVENPYVITLFNIGVGLFIAVPVIAIIYASLRALFGNRGRAPWLKYTLLAAWFIGILLIGYAVIENVGNFKSTATLRKDVALMQPANGHVVVQLVDSAGHKFMEEDQEESFNFSPNGLFINGANINEIQQIEIGRSSLLLMPSSNDSFYVTKITTSKGKTKADASKAATYAVYNFSQTDSVLNLPANTRLDKTGKFRFQAVKIRISIPEGKTISFANNIDYWPATVSGNASYNDTYFANTTWTNEKGIIKCITGENHFKSEEPETDNSDKENKE